MKSFRGLEACKLVTAIITAAEMKFLRRTEGKTIMERIRNGKMRDNLKLNTSEGKLTNNRIRLCRHVLTVNEGRIPKKVLNVKIKGKLKRAGDRDGDRRSGKMSHRRKNMGRI
jgi:hypothetical protein